MTKIVNEILAADVSSLDQAGRRALGERLAKHVAIQRAAVVVSKAVSKAKAVSKRKAASSKK